MLKAPTKEQLRQAVEQFNRDHRVTVRGGDCPCDICVPLGAAMALSNVFGTTVHSWAAVMETSLAMGDGPQFCRMILKQGLELGLRAAQIMTEQEEQEEEVN